MKFILITILIFYLLFKLGGYFLRYLIGNSYNERYKDNVNANKPNTPSKDQKRKGYKGGEYVDYEEVE